MIIINSRPGSLGYYLLHVAHLTWPDRFDYQTKKNRAKSWMWDDNWCRPDLYHGNQSTISQEVLDSLDSLSAQPCIVMVSNLDLVPSNLRNNSQIFTVTHANQQEKSQSTYRFWMSNDGDAEINDIKQNFQDPYQGYWQKLIRDIFDTPDPIGGTELRFANLDQLTEIQPFLTAVKNEYDLADPDNIDQLAVTYSKIYNQALIPIELFVEYNNFHELWTTILATPDLSRTSYTDSLSAEDVAKFKQVMDFIVNYSL